MNPVVVLDVDGVLCDPYPAISAIAVELYGAPEMRIQDIRYYDFLSYGYGIEVDDEFWRRVWTSELIRPMPWAAKVIDLLRRKELSPRLLSHRPSPEGQAQLFDFAKSIRVGRDEVQAVSRRDEKARIAADLGAVASLEDHPITAAHLGEVVRLSCLITKPWNLQCVDVKNRFRRVQSLAHFLFEVESLMEEIR